LKARLALLGFEAKVLSEQEGEKTLHKVRIGPYKSLDELNIARTRLTQGGMETILVKISPSTQQEQP
jgi:cell division protein FtsN